MCKRKRSAKSTARTTDLPSSKQRASINWEPREKWSPLRFKMWRLQQNVAARLRARSRRPITVIVASLPTLSFVRGTPRVDKLSFVNSAPLPSEMAQPDEDDDVNRRVNMHSLAGENAETKLYPKPSFVAAKADYYAEKPLDLEGHVTSANLRNEPKNYLQAVTAVRDDNPAFRCSRYNCGPCGRCIGCTNWAQSQERTQVRSFLQSPAVVAARKTKVENELEALYARWRRRNDPNDCECGWFSTCLRCWIVGTYPNGKPVPPMPKPKLY